MYTFLDAVADLRQSADLNPEKKAACSYGAATDRGENGQVLTAVPDCIVGDILAREFHIDPVFLVSLGGTAEDALPKTVKHAQFTNDALLVLRVVQRMQDGFSDLRFPWGAAVEKGVSACIGAVSAFASVGAEVPTPKSGISANDRAFQKLVESITESIGKALTDTERDLYHDYS